MVRYGKRFAKEMNRLANKYRSLPEDVEILIADLEHNPTQGASLGAQMLQGAVAHRQQG